MPSTTRFPLTEKMFLDVLFVKDIFKIQIKVGNVLLLLQLRMEKVSGAAALDESSLFCRFLGSFHSIGNSIPRPSSSRNFSLSTLGVPEFSGIVPSRGFIVKSEMLFLGGNLSCPEQQAKLARCKIVPNKTDNYRLF